MATPLDFVGEVSKVVELLAPATRTANTNGTGVDRTGYEHLVALLDLASVSGTTPTFDVKIQDSADNSAFADFTPNLLGTQNDSSVSIAKFPQQTAAGIVHLDVDLRAARQYIRAVLTVGGTTPSAILACNGLLLVRTGETPELST